MGLRDYVTVMGGGVPGMRGLGCGCSGSSGQGMSGMKGMGCACDGTPSGGNGNSYGNPGSGSVGNGSTGTLPWIVSQPFVAGGTVPGQLGLSGLRGMKGVRGLRDISSVAAMGNGNSLVTFTNGATTIVPTDQAPSLDWSMAPPAAAPTFAPPVMYTQAPVPVAQPQYVQAVPVGGFAPGAMSTNVAPVASAQAPQAPQPGLLQSLLGTPGVPGSQPGILGSVLSAATKGKVGAPAPVARAPVSAGISGSGVLVGLGLLGALGVAAGLESRKKSATVTKTPAPAAA